ncbi:hypothetical protein Rs2_16526 [Raphanus sativus]|nr:hypothetical protein Rs2_16526 [Raphanus sativus]
MSGFPLALQLVVYELIPVLSGRLGGTDEVKIIDCEALPQRKGLKLWDVLEAENDPQLMVEPMMDVPGDMPEGWGVWDDEIADRTVAYMVRRLCGGQQFLKSAWRGGDAQEDFYNHEDAKALRKRKREAGAAKTGVIAEPLLVQRRLSAYFRKPALVDNVSNGEVVSRLVALEKTVTWLKRKLSKRRRLGLTPRKELMRSGKKLKMKESGISKGRKSEDVSEDDEDEQVGDPDDVGPEYRGEGDTDDEGDGSGERDDGRRFSDDDFMEEDGGIDGNKDNERTPPPEIDNDVNNENVGGSEKVNEDSHVSGEASESENEVAETEEAGGGDIAGAGGVDSSSSSAEPPPVLLPLAEGDGVPLQWVEKGATGLDGTVLYRATTSQTYYVADEVVDDGSGSVKKDEQVSNSEAVDGDEHETSRLDELIGNIVTQGCGTEVVLDHEGGKNEPEQEKAEAAKASFL